MEFINFNDEKLPIGKRKQAYIKWAVSKGTDLITAKRQANKKFGFEQKYGLCVLYKDYGRMSQNSFRHSSIFDGFDVRKYTKLNSLDITEKTDNEIDAIKKDLIGQGWEVAKINLIP